MRRVTAYTLLIGAVATFATAPATADSTEPLGIYVVRGPAANLERFHAQMKDWQGGEFLERLSSKTEYRYWAYPTRAARDARMFIFGSMEHGLRIDIEDYDEATYYPKERALLNAIAATCGINSDPFKILPNRTLQVKGQAELRSKHANCIARELKKTDFGDEMPIRSPDNAAQSERG